jgi:hypothetical protein
MSGGKSHMRTEHDDELLLVNYLLGKLTEEEQVRVEDRAFADRDYVGAMDAAEADLIDAWVSGELPPADRRAFERRFLTSPQRLGKVEFARALARVTSEAEPVAVRVPKPPAWRSWLEPVRLWNPALRLAGAAIAVVCVAGGTWLVIENESMRSRVSALEAQRRELELRTNGLKQELSQSQSRADGLAAQAQNRPSSEAPRTPLVASLVLMGGVSRGESRVEQLVLDRGAQIAQIKIQLEDRDDYPRFRAELRTRNGKEILSLGDLTRRRSGEGFMVSMDLPASTLTTGEYELTLKGVRDGQDPQDIGFYYFRAVKR